MTIERRVFIPQHPCVFCNPDAPLTFDPEALIPDGPLPVTDLGELLDRMKLETDETL